MTVQLKSNDFAISCLALISFLSNIFRKMLMQNKTVFHDEKNMKNSRSKISFKHIMKNIMNISLNILLKIALFCW